MELTKEQVKEVLKDFSEYFDNQVLEVSMIEAYLNHKFPQKFKNGDIVKHKSGVIVYIVDIEKDKSFGFDVCGHFRQNRWILKTFLKGAQLAEHKEWIEKLIKEAKRRGLVEGVKVKSLDSNCLYQIEGDEVFITNEKGARLFLFDPKHNESTTIMKNGEWAKPLSNLDLKIEELKELAREEEMEIEVIFKNK